VATVEDAARNNAELCHLVCGGGRFGPDAWTTPAQPEGPYPDAVTLRPGASVPAILRELDPGTGCSIKDSFADLDLVPEGFRILFEAEWIVRAATGPAPDAPPAPRLVEIGGDGWSARLNPSANCVGLSNLVVDGAADDEAWSGAVAAAGHRHPGLSIVGYERDHDLGAARRHGFTTIGPLRVWIR
jgi:hypothetical protein